jgi:restriction system protein
MPRRKQQHLIDPGLAFGLFIAVGVIWLIAKNLQLLSLVFACGIGLIVLLVGVSYLRRVDAQRTLLQKAQPVVERQLSALVRAKAQLVWPDAYGRPQTEKWEKEKDRFITQHIELSLNPNERRALQRERPRVADLIEARVVAATQSQPAFRNFSDDMTPAEFEAFCAEELRRAGWNARVTMQSRDQGVDVVAEKDDMRVVVQCKLYGRPVGNKSVQEAAAARAHEKARYGIVVTNNRYTPAAEQLASTNGILLLHFSELQNLHNLLDR